MLNIGDELHDKAVAATEGLDASGIVTAHMVLVKGLNFRGSAGEYRRKLASKFTRMVSGAVPAGRIGETKDVYVQG